MSNIAQHALNQVRMVRIKQQLEAQSIAEAVQVQAMTCLAKALDDNQLLLDIDHLNRQVASIVIAAAKNGSLESLSDYIAPVAAQYENARAKATNDLHAMHSLNPGIYQSIKNEGRVNYRALGQDIDVEKTLGDVLTTSPDQVVSNGRHILRAVSIDAAQDVADRISEFAQANPDKNFTLLIPVNSHQSHWRLAEVQMCGEQVETAVLYDSMANASLAKTDAYKNLAKATGVEPLAIPVATQSNAVDCLPHVMQIAVHIASSSLPKDNSLDAISQARTSAQVREACVERMVALDRGQELGHVVLPAKEDVSFSADIEQAVDNNEAIQLEVDREMAENLQALYDSASDGDSEKDLVARARKSALESVTNRHRLFQNAKESVAGHSVSPGIANK